MSMAPERVRRTRFLAPRLDGPRWLVVSALAGAPTPLTANEMAALQQVPDDSWVEPSALDLDAARLRGLAEKGLVLLEHEPAEPFAEFRRRDGVLTGDGWEPEPAVYHFGTKLSGHEIALDFIDDARIARRGVPPDHFFRYASARSGEAPGPDVDLPLVEQTGGVFDTLGTRETRRFFNTSASLSLEHLALMLRTVFGAQAIQRQHPQYTMPHKTSPSGSSHSTEAFPVVVRVAGVAPGVYHYDIGRHALEPLLLAPADSLRALLKRWAVSQPHAADPAVGTLLAVRFDRAHWRHEPDPRMLTVTAMDIGHLSQTHYLVAEALGLSAFITASLNHTDIERDLGLDGYRLAPLVMLGLGVGGPPPPLPMPLPTNEPYTPRVS